MNFLVLSYVGYDLLKTTVNKIWFDADREVNFQLFQRILTQEKPITEQELDEAFKTLYGKDNRFNWHTVDFDRFRTDVSEVKLTVCLFVLFVLFSLIC